jgi:NAD(P)-dependent dehydrogenase (short-subunit alcohol dehydrogenase family)
MASVLITGANRGLGLEFTRQYAAAGWRVFAGCRSPEKADELQQLVSSHPGQVSVHALGVQDHAQIEALARELRGEPIDVLLNNAGIYGPAKMYLGEIDYRAWAEVFAVNTMAPLKLAECFVDNVARSERKVIAAITSLMGSIGANSGGRHYLYRSSKAGLNAVVRSLAIDLRDRGILAIVLHPGWVQTDMGGANADLKPADSVRQMIAVLDRLRPQDSGKFFNYDGKELPW